MSGDVLTAFVKKRQSQSAANKSKKKTISNVFTYSNESHWPLITDEDEKSKVLTCLRDAALGFVDFDSMVSSSAKPKKKIVRSLMRFGINEIVRTLDRDECECVLFDADIPRILSMHIIGKAISRRVPLLCVDGLKQSLDNNYGFKSSSVCFLRRETPVMSVVSDLCLNKFKSIYETEPKVNLVKDISNMNIRTENPEESVDFIKLEDNTRVAQAIKTSKRTCKFQPLLIKRIRMNPDR